MAGLEPSVNYVKRLQKFPSPHYKTTPPPPFLVKISHPPITAVFGKFHSPLYEGEGGEGVRTMIQQPFKFGKLANDVPVNTV